MSYADTYATQRPGPGARALAWMDDRAPLSWIAAVIAGFIFTGPFGLMILGFVLFTGRFRSAQSRANRALWREARSFGPRMGCHGARVMGRMTGNSAFDAYKTDTLARLEREQAEFEAFLHRLREARDKAEFDQYMDERARAVDVPQTAPAADATTGESTNDKPTA